MLYSDKKRETRRNTTKKKEVKNMLNFNLGRYKNGDSA